MSKAEPTTFLDRYSPPHIGTLVLLSGLSALAMNIFLPSLPGMTAHFESDYRLVQLSVALYLAVNAVLQLMMGSVSDRLGRRPVILAGLAIFLVATLGCIWASNIWVFLFFRMIQAAVVVGMVLGRAVVRDIVPEEQAASMIGYVTMGMAVVPMIGPAVGGLLDAAFGWQASFWLLFAVGLLTFLLTWMDLGETAPLESRSFREQITEYPELFASIRFWGYASTAALSAGSFFSYLGGAPYVGDKVFGLSPAELGFLFGAPAIGYFTGNFLSGRLSIRVGVNRMVMIGSVVNAAGMAVNLAMFYAGIGTVYSFFGLITMVGLGNGMVIPNATAGALSVRPKLAGTASGLAGALMIGGGAALSALAGALLGPETGAFPLLWLMFLSASGGVVAIVLVIRRDRKLMSDITN
ncbi:MAG: multidrug effflux MFS transporter [Pseudomonadota bacterium]